jgi:hypothetical protein
MIVDWEVEGGIAFMNNEGAVIYDFAVKIPDQPEVMPGEFYTFQFYNQNLAGNQCEGPFDAPYMYGKTIEIGKPFAGKDDQDGEIDIIKAIWTFADHDNDQCVSHDEMVAIMEWGTKDVLEYAPLVDAFFDSGDAS